MSNWKLVPVEPTEEMLRAAWGNVVNIGDLGNDYKKMLAAAPTPLAQDDELVYQSSWDEVYWADISKTEFDARRGITNIHTRTLYTRPDSSELRKAAVKYLKSHDHGNADERRRDVENLRAALEGK